MRCIFCLLSLANSSSIIDLKGVIPVPVAMNTASFSGGVLNRKWPFGPKNSISSSGLSWPSQLLPRPFATIFTVVFRMFSCGDEAMEYARKHGGVLSSIFMVRNWPAAKVNGFCD